MKTITHKLRQTAVVCIILLCTTDSLAQSTWIGPKWKDIAGKFDLSASYDSLKRVWSKKDQGGRFGGTLLVLEAAILDYYVKGAGTFLQKQIMNKLYPKTDPFMTATHTILAGIQASQTSVLNGLNAVWNQVHQDHSDMVFVSFTAASQALEDFRALQEWQRVDSVNRVKLDNAIHDLAIAKAWIEAQTQPGDVIGNLHRYMVIVRLLVDAKSEAASWSYLAPSYDMGKSPGQGYQAWLDGLTAEQRGEVVNGAAADVASAIERFLRTGTSSVFEYLLDQNWAFQQALLELRDQRFVDQGNQPGYTIWWYRVDSESSVECWQNPDDSCYYSRDAGSYSIGNFATYRSEAPENVIELHKWFAYNSMLMTVWAPIRIELDRLWAVSGAEGYRPIVPLDEDMDAYWYSQTNLTYDYIPKDPITSALDSLAAVTSSTNEGEWNFVEGCALDKGIDFINGGIQARSKDKLSSSSFLPDGYTWATFLSTSNSIPEVEAQFRSLFVAKFITIAGG